MLNRLFAEQDYCAIDIGSQRLKAGLIKVRDPDNMELINLAEERTKGYLDDSVVDLAELVDCLHSLIKTLTKKSGIKPKEIQLGVGGNLVSIRRNHSAIPLIERGNKIITKRDIQKVNNQARLLGIRMDEEVLHDFPQTYHIDDSSLALNPQGLYGRKLDVETLLIVSNGTKLQNVMKAVQQAGYEIKNLSFTSFSASTVALTKQQKKDGCALIDIGSLSTNILIFKDGILRYFEKFDWGGDLMTKAIAEELHLNLDLSEDIKKSYASALMVDHSQDEEILVKKDANYIPIKREVICHAMEPEVVRLIGKIESTVQKSGLANELNAGISVVGGGSLLPGLIERIEQLLNIPVAMGKVRIGTRSIKHVATYSGVVGLVKGAVEKSRKPLIYPNGHKGWPQSVISHIKEFYQEYF